MIAPPRNDLRARPRPEVPVAVPWDSPRLAGAEGVFGTFAAADRSCSYTRFCARGDDVHHETLSGVKLGGRVVGVAGAAYWFLH